MQRELLERHIGNAHCQRGERVDIRWLDWGVQRYWSLYGFDDGCAFGHRNVQRQLYTDLCAQCHKGRHRDWHGGFIALGC
jgi:hypothetical protein